MAGSKSDFLENELLDHVLGNQAYSPGATVWLALYTVAPDDTGGGTEVTGGSYARKEIANNLTKWPAASGGTKQNGEEEAFVTATGDWGTVVAFSIMDAVTAGNFLYWGDLTTSKPVNDGDTAKFPVGSITITEA